MKLLDKRKKRKRIQPHRSDASVAKNINAIYTRATERFPADLDLARAHIRFMRRQSEGNEVGGKALGKLYGRLLRLHPCEAGLWVEAANHEMFSAGNVSAARTLLQRGIRLNPQNQDLWLQLFRMEWFHLRRQRGRNAALGKEEDSDGTFLQRASEVPRVVLHSALDALPRDLKLFLGFLRSLATEFQDLPGAEAMKRELLELMLTKEHFRNSAEAIKAAAREPLLLTPDETAHELKRAENCDGFTDIEQACHVQFEASINAPSCPRGVRIAYVDFLTQCISKRKGDCIAEEISHVLKNVFDKVISTTSCKEEVDELRLRRSELMLRIGGSNVETVLDEVKSASRTSSEAGLVYKALSLRAGHLPGAEPLVFPPTLDERHRFAHVETSGKDGFFRVFGSIALTGREEDIKMAVEFLKWAWSEGGKDVGREAFKRATQMFRGIPAAVELWEAQIDVELSYGGTLAVTAVRAIYDDAINQFPECPRLWERYAMFEEVIAQDVSRAATIRNKSCS